MGLRLYGWMLLLSLNAVRITAQLLMGLRRVQIFDLQVPIFDRIVRITAQLLMGLRLSIVFPLRGTFIVAVRITAQLLMGLRH